MERRNYKTREQLEQALAEAVETMKTHSRYSREYVNASVNKSRLRKRLLCLDKEERMLRELASKGKFVSRISKNTSIEDLCATLAQLVTRKNEILYSMREPQNHPEYPSIYARIRRIRKRLVSLSTTTWTSEQKCFESFKKTMKTTLKIVDFYLNI